MSISYEKYKELSEKLRDKLNDDLNETQITETKNTFINKYLSPLYEKLKIASVSEKKEWGKIANFFKNDINTIVDESLKKYREKAESTSHKVDYDILINSTNLNKANLTPLNIMTNLVIKYFEDLGFAINDGSEIVEEKYNFDFLNIDINHPSRTTQDSFYIDEGRMLRTHNTAVSVQQIENNIKSDLRVLCYGNVYRKDEDDATHSHQFMQVDVIWSNNKLSILNLK
jgi:phenylalanyl-tRNA synthetase alpha chain